MSHGEEITQYRFFEDNPNVVKECQGWQKWETIESRGKLAEIREYITWGKKYQIRTLTQTHTEGLQLIYMCMAPNRVGRQVLEEQIVPSLDAIRRYLVKHDIISGSSNELGFVLLPGSVAGRFWSKCTLVAVRNEYIGQIGVEYGYLEPLLKCFTSKDWQNGLSTVYVEQIEVKRS